jgi:hypothetical protein
MINVMIKNDELFLMCTTPADSAQLAHWIESSNPVLSFKEFYGHLDAEPCEYEENEGGLHLSKVGYLTRQIGSTVWNKNVLK